MLLLLKLRNGQRIDPIVLGVRPDEFDKCDAPAEIESHDHPKIASGDFEPRAFPIQDFCVWGGKAHVSRRTPFGALYQRPPTMKRYFRLRMPLGKRRKHAPRYNSHARQYVPAMGTLQ
jgi:hypothetical protein